MYRLFASRSKKSSILPLTSNILVLHLTMKSFKAALIILLASTCAAYQQSTRTVQSKNAFLRNLQNTASGALLSTSLGFLLLAEPSAAATSAASAQIDLKTLPPNSISVQIRDLPVVGPLISGTYTKVPDGSIKNPSVVIQSPKDKLQAVKAIATTGHLEFDVNGLIGTHLDVDIAADQAGVATVRVASPLIPKLPFQNAASANSRTVTGGKESPWSQVTNLGSGESYYYNEKTGVTQYERPF